MLAWGYVFLLAGPPVHGGLAGSGVRLVVVRMGHPDSVPSTISKIILI